MYVAGQDGLRIVSVADATVVASPELPGGSHQMILDGTRLLVATQGFTTAEDTVVSRVRRERPDEPGAAAPLASRRPPRRFTSG